MHIPTKKIYTYRVQNKIFNFILLNIVLLTPSLFGANIKCAQFKTYHDAEQYYNAHENGYQSLDRNSNGIPCEHLKKVTSKQKKKVRLKIYKYGYPYSIGEKFSSLQSCEDKKIKLAQSHTGLDYSYACE